MGETSKYTLFYKMLPFLFLHILNPLWYDCDVSCQDWGRRAVKGASSVVGCIYTERCLISCIIMLNINLHY